MEGIPLIMSLDDIILVGKYVYGCWHQYPKHVEWWGLVGVVGTNIVMGMIGDLAVVGPKGGGASKYTTFSKLNKYFSELQICQMSESQTAGLWRTLIKKEPDIIRLRHNEVNFDITCKGHQNYSKAYFMDILRCFDDHQIPPQKFL